MSQIHRIQEAGWSVGWSLTESAGLKIFLADFRGRRVLWEALLPYVTIDHSPPEDEVSDLAPDDAHRESHGPWWAPLGLRTLVGGVRATSFRGGFELAADFASGPYRFTQLWRFHANGRLDPWLTLHGPGLRAPHTYHPHWRFDFDVDGARWDSVEYWEPGQTGRSLTLGDGRWSRAAEETWLPFRGETSPAGFAWRQIDLASGLAVNLRPHHNEDPEVFALRYHQGDWPPLAPLPSATGEIYPSTYAGTERLDSADVVLWYVAHVRSGPGFPLTAGPWIRLEGF